MKICICGGGSLGHVCAGMLSSKANVNINLLTGHPNSWNHNITITDINKVAYQGTINKISDNAEELLTDCDIVLICQPGYMIEKTLYQIKPFINNSIVGSIVSNTGFFFNAHKILGEQTKLFGFQRSPYIARTSNYGHSADLLGYKSQLFIAVENIPDRESFCKTIEDLFGTRTRLLNNYYEASLSNSNPILHTGRLYSLWNRWNGELYDHNILFYKEWRVGDSDLLLKMDAEFMSLLDVLPVKKGSIPSLLEYYECDDAIGLTHKINSIPAFQKILSPMKKVDGGWIPDFSNRYFTEDFPFGLRFIVDLANSKGITAPYINKVYEWGKSKCK